MPPYQPTRNPAPSRTIDVGFGQPTYPANIQVLTPGYPITVWNAEPLVVPASPPLADTDASYVTKASLSAGLNTGFVGRIEVSAVVAKFGRLKMIALANAVNVTARVF